VGAPASAPPPGGTWTPAPNVAPYGTQQVANPEKPIGAMVLSIVGGIFILLGGLVGVWLGTVLAALTFGLAGGTVVVLGAVGMVIGLVTIVLGVLLGMHPRNHTMYGALIIVLAIVSWVTAFGGFFIGFLLALIGGILALTYKTTAPVVWQQPVQRVCPKCGRVVDPNVKFCPACGNSLG
jgi:hypothetical protein